MAILDFGGDFGKFLLFFGGNFGKIAYFCSVITNDNLCAVIIRLSLCEDNKVKGYHCAVILTWILL